MLSLRTNNYPVVKNDRAIHSLLDDFFGENFFAPMTFSKVSDFSNSFKIDVKENDQAYQIEAEMPGINKADIGLEYKEDRLYISVNKSEEVNQEKDNYIYKERQSQAMNRAVYLKGIDSNNITAKLDNGILTIVAPKTVVEENQYKIEIQ